MIIPSLPFAAGPGFGGLLEDEEFVKQLPLGRDHQWEVANFGARFWKVASDSELCLKRKRSHNYNDGNNMKYLNRGEFSTMFQLNYARKTYVLRSWSSLFKWSTCFPWEPSHQPKQLQATAPPLPGGRNGAAGAVRGPAADAAHVEGRGAGGEHLAAATQRLPQGQTAGGPEESGEVVSQERKNGRK